MTIDYYAIINLGTHILACVAVFFE